jgi:hypothetical protein
MRSAVVLVCLALCACVQGATAALEARLESTPSATAALEGWCAERRLAAEPRVLARRVGADKPAPVAVRAALRAGSSEPIAYRGVELVCGTVVLSVADNWYLPARLTPAMNRTLAETDTPFGRVVAPLNFTRRRLSARRGPAPFVLEHRAVLSTASGVPFSYVVERYTAAAVRSPG